MEGARDGMKEKHSGTGGGMGTEGGAHTQEVQQLNKASGDEEGERTEVQSTDEHTDMGTEGLRTSRDHHIKMKLSVHQRVSSCVSPLVSSSSPNPCTSVRSGCDAGRGLGGDERGHVYIMAVVLSRESVPHLDPQHRMAASTLS
ncbi:hypothetical protein Q7C36_017794 [Tachysurus vachellii]|uniref:Uncharacterized protein n=1 Tax=Tachysurus vachellii TaxID=175792 RepID=A0AA88M4C1_TACVA|nr:hypothetical protein Q7C36_017794 [Tachysurus vachellii]